MSKQHAPGRRRTALRPQPVGRVRHPGPAPRQRGRRRLVRRERRPARRPGGRVGQRQVGDLARDHGPAAAAGRAGHRRGPVRGREPPRHVAPPAEQLPGPGHLDGVPGPDDLAEPGGDDRRPARRGHRGALRGQAQGGDAPGRAPAGAGEHPRPGPAAQGVPAPALRRHAAARADRDRAGLRAAAAHRRRADDRARRDHPGPGARGAQDCWCGRPTPRCS